MHDSILITDDIDTANNFNDGPVILWNEYYKRDNITSIPLYIFENKEEIRNELLDILHRIGVYSINNKSVLEHLEIEDNFSYWWITSLGQAEPYSNGKSIYDLMKLICLNKLLDKQNFKKILIDLKNKKNLKVINACIEGNNIIYKSELPYFQKIKNKYFNFDAIYLFINLIKFCLFSMQRIEFNNSKNKKNLLNYDIHIFDVFTHFKIDSNVFKSGYWNELKEHLDGTNLRVEWNHFYFKNNNESLKRSINDCLHYDTTIQNNSHKIIDATINLNNFLYVVKKIMMLFFKNQSILKKNSNNIFLIQGKKNKFNFYSIISNEMSKSMFGIKAFLNIFHFRCLNEKILSLNKDAVCLFIQENQPWEYALTYFWRKNLNNKIIGYPHTTIPFFDFRYYFSKKTFELPKFQPHLPRIMAINGSDMMQKLKIFDYLPSEKINVEALRYNYLNKIKLKKKDNYKGKMLLIGDLVKDVTLNQLEFIQLWRKKFNPEIKIIFRPHPSAKVKDYSKYSFLSFSRNSLIQDINNCDIFVVNNTTSAAADIYALGLPLITYNDLERINFSPILGNPNSITAENIDDFQQSFQKLRKLKLKPNDYFHINKEIPMWKKLLEKVLRNE